MNINMIGSSKTISLHSFDIRRIVHCNTLVDCGGLSGPLNGQVRLTGTLLGSMASFTCNSGHVLIGNHTRECLYDGTWSDEVPHCVLTSSASMIGVGLAVFSVVLLLVGMVLVTSCFIYYWKRRQLKSPAIRPELFDFSEER